MLGGEILKGHNRFNLKCLSNAGIIGIFLPKLTIVCFINLSYKMHRS